MLKYNKIGVLSVNGGEFMVKSKLGKNFGKIIVASLMWGFCTQTAATATELDQPLLNLHKDAQGNYYQATEMPSVAPQAIDKTMLTESTKKVKKNKKQKQEKEQVALPTTVYAENLTFDNKTGNIQATGKVQVVRGGESILTDKLDGNYNTGDLWLHEGGQYLSPTADLTAVQGQYNYNEKTGSMQTVQGKIDKEYITSEQVDIYPDRYKAGKSTITRCNAHKPDFYAKAERVDIFPGKKMVAYNMKVYIKDQFIYAQERYVQDITPGQEDSMIPTIRYDNKDGFEIKKRFTKSLGHEVDAFFDFDLFSDAGFKPVAGVIHDTNNYKMQVLTGEQRDSDRNWITKEPEARFDYKTKKIADTHLNYSFYALHGKWVDEHKTSWHTDMGVSVSRDPIYLSKDKDLWLNLGTGYSRILESYDDSKRNVFSANGVLHKRFDERLQAWTGYYYTSDKNSLFDYDDPDMSKEIRTGLAYRLTGRDVLTVEHRYDVQNQETYDLDFTLVHNLHCMELELGYRSKRNEFNMHWRLINW